MERSEWGLVLAEHGHMRLSPAIGRKAMEYEASKQWPSASLNIEEVSPREWVDMAVRMAGGSLSEGGVHATWDGLGDGV